MQNHFRARASVTDGHLVAGNEHRRLGEFDRLLFHRTPPPAGWRIDARGQFPKSTEVMAPRSFASLPIFKGPAAPIDASVSK